MGHWHFWADLVALFNDNDVMQNAMLTFLSCMGANFERMLDKSEFRAYILKSPVKILDICFSNCESTLISLNFFWVILEFFFFSTQKFKSFRAEVSYLQNGLRRALPCTEIIGFGDQPL